MQVRVDPQLLAEAQSRMQDPTASPTEVISYALRLLVNVAGRGMAPPLRRLPAQGSDRRRTKETALAS